MLLVRCPNPECGKAYHISDERIGQVAVCKRCGRRFKLTSSERETRAPANEELDTAASAPPSRAEMRKEAGDPKVLGRFEIRYRLGAGAFGTVYRAHDPVLDREVALKVPRTAVLQNVEARARFLREPKAAAQLRHPHIVPIYDSGSDGDHYYIASAFIEGRTLEEVITADRPDCRTAARIVADLANALQYAHQTGVVHRDIKPANIMIDERGQALLMDFGLARLESAPEKLTHDGSVMGTPAYMSPEQAGAPHGEVGPASDQYALGVVLYELLCGAPPFSGPPAVVIYKVAHQDPPAIRHVNRNVPRDLETIVAKAMSKQPGNRYPDCGALADDLRRWLADEPIRARPLGPLERLGRWTRRNPSVAGLVAAVILVTVLGLSAVTAFWRRAEHHRQLAENNLARARTEERRATSSLAEANRQRKLAETNLAEAETQRQRAETAQAQLNQALEKAQKHLQEAQRQRDAATKAQEGETTQRARAEKMLSEANRQRERAEMRERLARRQLYAIHMNLACRAYEEHDLERVRELLEQHEPAAEEEDLRGFEWYCLRRMAGIQVAERRLEIPFFEFRHGRRGIVSRDGRLVGGAHVRCTETGKRLWSEGRLVGFSPDSKTAWVERPETAKKRDTKTGAYPKARRVPRSGRGLRTIVEARDARTGKVLRSFVTGAGSRVTLSADGKRIAVVSADASTIRFWDTASCQQHSVSIDIAEGLQNEGEEWIGEGVFSPCSLLFAAEAGSRVKHGGSTRLDSKGVHIWSVSQGDAIRILGGGHTRRGAAFPLARTCKPVFSPDGTSIATEVVGGIAIWNVSTGRQTHAIHKDDLQFGYSERVLPREFLPLGNRLVITNYAMNNKAEDGRFAVWDLVAGEKLKVRAGQGHFYMGVLPDGDLLTIAGERFVKIPIDYGSAARRLHTGPVSDVNLLPGNQVLASCGEDGIVKLTYASTGRSKALLRQGGSPVRNLSVDRSGKLLVVASRGQPVTLWDPATLQRQTALNPGTEGSTRALAAELSPQGDVVAAGYADGYVALFDASDGALQANVQVHDSELSELCLAFSDNGKTIASGASDGTVRLWQPGAGNKATLLGEHSGPVRSIAFLPGESMVASASEDGTIRLWNPTSAGEAVVLRGHQGRVHCLAISPDGQTLFSAGSDKVIRCWDTQLHVEKARLTGHGSPVRSLAISPDGTFLVSGTQNGSVRVWHGR